MLCPVTPWTETLQASLTMGFSRQEYWSGLPFPSPGDLPNPRMEPASLALTGRLFNWTCISCIDRQIGYLSATLEACYHPTLTVKSRMIAGGPQLRAPLARENAANYSGETSTVWWILIADILNMWINVSLRIDEIQYFNVELKSDSPLQGWWVQGRGCFLSQPLITLTISPNLWAHQEPALCPSLFCVPSIKQQCLSPVDAPKVFALITDWLSPLTKGWILEECGSETCWGEVGCGGRHPLQEEGLSYHWIF